MANPNPKFEIERRDAVIGMLRQAYASAESYEDARKRADVVICGPEYDALPGSSKLCIIWWLAGHEEAATKWRDWSPLEPEPVLDPDMLKPRYW